MPRPTLPVPIDDQHGSPLARLICRSRIIVIVAVAAVMASAISLFLLGAALAGETIWSAWRQVLGGEIGTTLLTVRFLEIVTVMLKAVFFYIIGVGLYSLFISPLNVTVALGVETLNDLETKNHQRDRRDLVGELPGIVYRQAFPHGCAVERGGPRASCRCVDRVSVADPSRRTGAQAPGPGCARTRETGIV